jgi:RND family efflux transporter MFP subunit
MSDRKRLVYTTGVILVLLCLGGVGGLQALRSSRVREEERSRKAAVAAGPRIQTAPVVRGGGERSLVVQGEARPYFTVTLYAKVSGYLKDVLVDKGDKVTKDQVLARIESPELEREYEAQLADAKYKRDNARRLEALQATGIASASDTELARSSAEVSEANVATLATEKGYEILKAPFSGTVTARYADPGALLQQATAAQTSALPVVTVAQLDRLRVDLYVDQRDAPYVHPGDPVEVGLPERLDVHLPGKVARVSHELDPKTRMMLAEIDLDNSSGGVVPGSFVEVKLKVPAPPTLSVPIEALVLRGQQHFVAVVSGTDTVAYVPVVLSETDGQRAYIKDGVQEGQQVALNLGDTVGDGSSVRPARPTPPGGGDPTRSSGPGPGPAGRP